MYQNGGTPSQYEIHSRTRYVPEVSVVASSSARSIREQLSVVSYDEAPDLLNASWYTIITLLYSLGLNPGRVSKIV